MIIRPAEPRDIDALGRLGAMLMRMHYTFDPLRFLEPREGTEKGYGSFLVSLVESEDARVFVAEDGDAVVGYVYVTLEPLSWRDLRGPAGFLQDIVVAEGARRAGVGTALLQKAMEWLRERGAPRVILWSAAPNETAQALFRRLGFRDTMVEMTREL